MTWEIPDRTEDHHPEGACPCGRDLADAADLGVARSYQQEEIPVAAAERVQRDLHESRCACGRVHAAARPAGVPDSALSIGPRLRAPGRLPGRLPACSRGAVPAADRRRHRRCRIRRVHPFLPGEGSVPGGGRGAADPHPDHRRAGRRVRRDHAAVRAGPGEEIRPRRVHREVLGVLAGHPQPGLHAGRRHPPGFRRGRGLRPVPELLSSTVGAHRREPGMPFSPAA